jgi:uncharacterized OB-fold protein
MTTPVPAKPLPTILPLEKPFWEAARGHRLSLQRCSRCRAWRFPASPVCAECDSPEFHWEPTGGRGTIVSWVVFHRLYFPSFAPDLPYNVALVRLDEGPVLPTNIVGCERSALHSGLPVEVVFEQRTPEISIPMFRPVRGPSPDGHPADPVIP